MTNLHIIAVTCLFMVLDIITGFIKAWKDNDVQSKALRAGLFHKASFILVIVLAQAVELAADEIPQLQLDMPLVGAVCAYVILTEVISVLENLKAMNPQIGGVMNKFPVHPADEPDEPDGHDKE